MVKNKLKRNKSWLIPSFFGILIILIFSILIINPEKQISLIYWILIYTCPFLFLFFCTTLTLIILLKENIKTAEILKLIIIMTISFFTIAFSIIIIQNIQSLIFGYEFLHNKIVYSFGIIHNSFQLEKIIIEPFREELSKIAPVFLLIYFINFPPKFLMEDESFKKINNYLLIYQNLTLKKQSFLYAIISASVFN